MSAGSLRKRTAVWLRSMVFRRRLEGDIDEEIRFHLQARADDLIASGVPVAEAVRQARVEFGGTETHKHDMRSAFGLRWWDDLLMDTRYAWRVLRKSWGFTAVAVGSLALAIGANTTIFSAATEMLYAQLALPHAKELRLLTLEGPEPLVVHSSWGSNSVENGREHLDMFPYPVFRKLQAEDHSTGPIVGFKDLYQLNVTANGEPQSMDVQLVSGNFFGAMEVKPQLGRPILPADEDRGNAAPVALISDNLWHRTFDGSPAVIGRTLRVNGADVTIIGVNPRGFTGAESVQIVPDVFLPLSTLDLVKPVFLKRKALITSDLWWVNLMTRTLPGVPDKKAAADLNYLFSRDVRGSGMLKVQPTDHMPEVLLEDGSRGLNRSGKTFAQPIYILLGMTGLVLLLACANTANLMLARAIAREREMTVRLALGASRSRVLRQMLTESLLISGMGGTLGFVLGYAGRNFLPGLIQAPWERHEIVVAFDWRVFAFTAAITLGTGLAFGLLPAWRATMNELTGSLRESGKSATPRRKAWSGRGIVAFQVMLSTVLVVGSALFVRTVINLYRVDPGFRTENLLQFDLSASAAALRGAKSIQMSQRLEESLAQVPGVQGVTLATPALLAGSQYQSDFVVEHAPRPAGGDDRSSYYAMVGEHFFTVMGIPVLRGRSFGSQDSASSPLVSVINQALANKFFPHSDPLGRRFRVDDKKPLQWYTIVGVCGDTLYSNMTTPVRPLHFDLYTQADDISDATYTVRSSQQPSDLVSSLRRAVQSVDPDLPLNSVRTQQQQIDEDLQQQRLFASLTASFGLLALLLACVGIYGVMAYTVSRRTNEIGIRLALGAQRYQIRGMVLREAAWLAIAGVFTGLGIALALVRLVQSLLFGVEARDPTSLAIAAVVLLVVAMLSGWVPAARASRVEPVRALRHE